MRRDFDIYPVLADPLVVSPGVLVAPIVYSDGGSYLVADILAGTGEVVIIQSAPTDPSYCYEEWWWWDYPTEDGHAGLSCYLLFFLQGCEPSPV